MLRRLLEGRWPGRRRLERRAVFRILHLVQAAGIAFAQVVDGNVVPDRHEPGDEAVAPVVEMPLFQHAQPDLLKQVFSDRAIAGEVQQITQQPVLILLDQRIEQIRIAAPEPLAIWASSVSIGTSKLDKAVAIILTGYTGEGEKKTHGQDYRIRSC